MHLPAFPSQTDSHPLSLSRKEEGLDLERTHFCWVRSEIRPLNGQASGGEREEEEISLSFAFGGGSGEPAFGR